MPAAGASVSVSFLSPFGFNEANLPTNMPLTMRQDAVGSGSIMQIRFGGPNDAHILGSIANDIIAGPGRINSTEIVTIPVNTAGPRLVSDFDAWGTGYGVAVMGVVDDNMSAFWASYYARQLESRNIPVVVVVNGHFEQALRNGAVKNGFTEMRIVVIDSMLYSRSLGRSAGAVRDAWVTENILQGADGVIRRADDGFRLPLTPAELSPPAITSNVMGINIPGSVSGTSLTAAGRNFTRISRDYNFGDGLPLVIPTQPLVNAMLAQSGGRAGSEILGMMVGGGIITVENVAVNAVMAGAAPEYFPVILAAMEAFATEREDGLNFDRVMRQSAGNVTIIALLSGPLTEEIGMASNRAVNDDVLGGGLYGNTHSPNVSIGRAIRLAYRNIGLNRPEDTRARGNMLRLAEYNIPVLGEVIGDLPSGWQQHSERLGFGANSNTVSLLITSQARLTSGHGGGLPGAWGIEGFITGPRGAIGTEALRGAGVVSIVAMGAPMLQLVTAEPIGSGQIATSNINQNFGGLGISSQDELQRQLISATTAVQNRYQRLVWPVTLGGEGFMVKSYNSGAAEWGSGFAAMRVGATQVPSAPLNFAVNFNPRLGTAALTWAAPTRTVGAVRYEVSADGGATWVNAGAALTHTFTDVNRVSNPVFAVRAVNTDAANSAEIADVSGLFEVVFENRSGRGAWAIYRLGL